MSSLHRNNAAEWVIWTALLPLVPIAWMIEKVRQRRSDLKSQI